MIHLKGQKVILRDWLSTDLEVYQSWHQGSPEWKQFDAPYYPNDEKEFLKSLEILNDRIQRQDFPDPRMRLVVADPATNRLVGTVNAYWISKETHWLAAGIVLFDPRSWGGGIGREALAMWIDYQFANRPEIVRLDLQTWSGNERMMRLAAKLGFQLEGQFRKARIVNGQHFDSMQYGLLREEWQALNDNPISRS